MDGTPLSDRDRQRAETDPLLDIRDAAAAMTEALGRPFGYDQVRAMADRGVLPFFKDPATGKRLAFRSELLAFYWRQQNAASRQCRDRLEAAGEKHPRRR